MTARVRRTGVLALALTTLLAAPATEAQTVLNPSGNSGFAAPDVTPAAKPNARTARAAPEASRTATATQSIVALVNDEPITGYEIEQRMRLSLLGAPEIQQRMQKRLKSANVNEQFKAFAMKQLKANPPKTEAEQQARVQQLQGQFVESVKREVEAEFRPLARKSALDELIEERLKLQEAKRLNVVATNEDVDRIVNGMAERNKMTAKQFADHMAKMGSDIAAMRAKITASLSWADVIRRRFGHQISVAGRDIDRFVATAEGQDDVELRVHRIMLATPADLGQAQVAQRLSDAERIRAQFSGCKSTDALARGVPGARFDDLGHRRPSQHPRADAQPAPQRGRRGDAASHHRRGRRRAVGGVRTQGHQGGGGEARDSAERPAPEGVRDPVQEAPEGPPPGRPHRAPVMSPGPQPGRRRLPIAVSMGDPAGIGLEIALKAWSDRIDKAVDPFVLFADPDAVAERARSLGLMVPLETRAGISEAADVFATALPLRPVALATPARPGSPDTANAAAVIASIEQAVEAVYAGEAAALVTNPISKHVLAQSGFPYPWPHRVPGGAGRAACPRQEIPPRHDAGIARAARCAADGALRAGVGARRDHARADLRDGAHHL